MGKHGVDTDRLRGVLGRRGRVAFAFIFGSSVAGTESSGSDIDIAVWLVNGPADREWAYRSLLPDLMAAAGTDAVDLTVLNDAPPALRFAVQKTGELLFQAGEAGRHARSLFEQRARKDYWDFRPRLVHYAEQLSKRLERGSFGA